MACLIPILSITRKVIEKVPFTATGSEDGFFTYLSIMPYLFLFKNFDVVVML